MLLNIIKHLKLIIPTILDFKYKGKVIHTTLICIQQLTQMKTKKYLTNIK